MKQLLIILISALIGGYIATHLRAKAVVNPRMALNSQCFDGDTFIINRITESVNCRIDLDRVIRIGTEQ